MSWQTLKLKRIKRKKDIPTIVNHIKNIELNGQVFHFFEKDGRYYFHNTDNHKWSELINEIR
jgi:hypothetical protein